jgi:hypothetical protein
MSDKDKPSKVPSRFANFWNSLDKSIQIILVGGAVILVLYYLMSPLQQCKRERSNNYFCYKTASW